MTGSGKCRRPPAPILLPGLPPFPVLQFHYPSSAPMRVTSRPQPPHYGVENLEGDGE